MWGIQQIENEKKKEEELDLMMECVRLYPDEYVFNGHYRSFLVILKAS